jgi:hydrogenase maturation protein HypF
MEGPYLGVSWDGTGYGLDRAIWGGEFFRVDGRDFQRVAHLRSFQLPGGEAAVREGWRSAASLMFEIFGAEATDPKVRPILERSANVVPTTSVGRLFDAVACITVLTRRNQLEGQAAMLLENEIAGLRTEEAYPLAGGDWVPLIQAVILDKRAGIAVPLVAARFHNALVEWILEVATQVGLKQIVLSGGVFQNRYLTERAVAVLESRGSEVFTHRQVPPNDGGIALGQVVMAENALS